MTLPPTSLHPLCSVIRMLLSIAFLSNRNSFTGNGRDGAMKHNEYRTLTSYLTFPPVGAMMSVGNFGNPHATCRIAAHPWDRRVLPLVRECEIR